MKLNKRLFLLFFLFSLASRSLATTYPVTCTGTNDHTAINSAISAASTDDIVSIAVGSCGIADTVTVSKGITLQGAGKTLTTFTGSASPMVTVSHGSSTFARVTGIYFNTTASIALRLSGTIYQVRIDNNKFGGADNGVYSSGVVEGVVDHNEFLNCDRCTYVGGTDTPMWTIDFNAGTGNFVAGGSHALFFEDNTFTRNNSFSKAGNEISYNQEGARTVFRYNTYDESAWTAETNLPWEQHGNQSYYDSQNHPPDTFRGQPITEIYNNTFLLRGSPRVISPRSGSLLIHDNTITVSSPGDLSQLIVLIEEETYTSPGAHFYQNNDFVWPTEDMITNTFIWNNTINGSALTTSHVDGWSGTDCCGTYPDTNYVINFNRDVWMHAPEASGGRTYYNNRPGASGRDADGTLVFTQSGANAYYPYTPYTYPHPLATPPHPHVTIGSGPGMTISNSGPGIKIQ